MGDGDEGDVSGQTQDRMPGTAGILPGPGDPGLEQGGWHSRHYLPHYDQPDLLQSITFRLADSLPEWALARLEEEVKGQPDVSVGRRKRLQILMDAGYGACYLREKRIARLVEESLLHFDGLRYRLLAWTVMPNHVHVLIETVQGIAFQASSTLGSHLHRIKQTKYSVGRTPSGTLTTSTERFGTAATALPRSSTSRITRSRPGSCHGRSSGP